MHVHVSFIYFLSSSLLSLLLLPPPARHCIPQDLCVSFTLFSLNYSLCYVFRFSDILQILKNYSLRFIYYILLDVSFFRTSGVIGPRGPACVAGNRRALPLLMVKCFSNTYIEKSSERYASEWACFIAEYNSPQN